MNYSFTRVYWYLIHHRKIYLFILLEYTIAIIVLVSCLNIFYSSKDTLKELKNQLAHGTIPITYMTTQNTSNDDTFPITYKNYLNLSDKHRDNLRMSFAQYCSTIYSTNDKLLDFDILFMNENMFEDVFGYTQEENLVYVGHTAYEEIQTILSKYNNGILNENIQSLNSEFLLFKKGKIGLPENIFYNTKIIEGVQRSKYISKSYGILKDNILIDNCIIFPLNGVIHMEGLTPLAPYSILSVKSLNNESEDANVSALVSDLSSLQEGYQFSVADQYLRTKGSIEDLNAKYETYFLAACAIIVIVVNGIIGMLLIFLYRRKRSMAISLAYGATLVRIAEELILEVFAVLMGGCILGLAGAYFYSSNIYLLYTEVHFYPECVLLVVIISCISSFLTCFFALLGLKKEAPIQVLRDN